MADNNDTRTDEFRRKVVDHFGLSWHLMDEDQAAAVETVLDAACEVFAATPGPSRPPVADNDQAAFLDDNRQQLALARHIRGLGSQTAQEQVIEINPAYVARKLIEDGWRKTEGA